MSATLVGLGALTRLRELGVAVPEDLSVIGFDDISLDHFGHSAITMVSVPRDRLGHEAGTLLERHLTVGADSEPRYLPTELLIRDTSGPPP